MKNFHIWDLERVNIKLRDNFISKINKDNFLKFKTIREAYNQILPEKNIPFSTFKNFLKQSHLKNFFVPLNVYMQICNNLKINEEELEQNITAYKTAGGTNYIENPILPIKITPVFDMLFAHHIGDGTVINPKKGRLPYFGYRQFDKFYRLAYVKKLEAIFGKINFFKENYFESSTRPYCPPVLSSLFFKYYKLKIEDFLSDKARISRVIFDKGKESMLAVLIAFIIDEGYVDSTQITIGLKNKMLIEDLKKICDMLEYKSKILPTKSEINKDYWKLYILREGMKKLWVDYLELNKKYSIIDLGRKGEKINSSFLIYDRKIKKIKGNQNIIFEILKNEQLSVNQLAERITMTRQGVRYHIHNLLKEGKIKIITNNELNWIYGV